MGNGVAVLLQCCVRVSLFLQVRLGLPERLWSILLTWFVVNSWDHTSVAPILLFLLVSVGPRGLPKAVPLRRLHLLRTWANLSRPPVYSLHGDAYLLILTFPR